MSVKAPVSPRKHGCHNRSALLGTVAVQDGWYAPPGSPPEFTRAARMVVIPDPMTKDCRYTDSNPDDPGCSGCKWQKITIDLEGF